MKKTSELIWQDTQHQILFELIDQINECNVGPTIFQRLYDYAENHFKLEEAYMVELDYPDTEAHVIAHDKFRAELDDMINSDLEYDETFRKALAEFLSNWLRSHIFGIDKGLEDFILKSSRK